MVIDLENELIKAIGAGLVTYRTNNVAKPQKK